MNNLISSQIRRFSEKNPEKIAIYFENNSINYETFCSNIDKVKNIFREQKIKKGDVLALMMDSPLIFSSAMLAIEEIGAICLPINHEFDDLTINIILKKYNVKKIFTDSQDVLSRYNEVFYLNKKIISQVQTEFIDNPENDFIDPNSPFVIALPLLLSLGDNVNEKINAILYSHQYTINRINLTLNGLDQTLNLIPPDINFTMGFLSLIGTLYKGGTVIFRDNCKTLDCFDLAKKYKANVLFISATEIENIVHEINDDSNLLPLVTQFRLLEGSPTPALIDTIFKKISPKVCTSYGSAETGGLTLATPDILKKFPNASGKVRPWATLEIVDTYGNPVQDGVIGEIRAKSEIAAKSYYLDQDKSAAKFKNGWFYTGDFGYFNEEKILFLSH